MNIFVHFLGRRRSRRVVEFAQRMLSRARGRVGVPIREIRLRRRYQNGARGGVDHRCSLEIRMAHGGIPCLHKLDAKPGSAVHRLARRAGRLPRDAGQARRGEIRR
jgi:hypothetical protein